MGRRGRAKSRNTYIKDPWTRTMRVGGGVGGEQGTGVQ